MKGWQRIARLVIAVCAVAFATVVALTLRSRTPQIVQGPVPRTDPQAAAEGTVGFTFRVNRNKEEIRIVYDKFLTYPDGSNKMLGVKVTTERAGGRTFVITGKEGKVGDAERTVTLKGDVRVETNDGLVLTTDTATYAEDDGIAHAPGLVQFSRGRMTGSGVGFEYDKNQDILKIAEHVAVHVVPDEGGQGALDVASGSLEFQRSLHLMHFDGHMKATGTNQVVESATAVAHLSADEQRLEALELRGGSSISTPSTAPGGLEAMTGREIDLRYGPDGQIIEHAVVNGDAVIRLAGDTQQPGRRIDAQSVDVTLAKDGSTPTALTARERVQLLLPGEANGVSRTIQAATLSSNGDETLGLRTVRFTGDVQFAERGADVNRTARSNLLDVILGQGFGAIEDAQFAQSVRFVDGALTATAAQAKYGVDKGTLELSGSDPASLVPHVVNEQIRIDAAKVDLTLDGPIVRATGSVKSVILPKSSAAAGSKGAETHMPSMLKSDQPVNVTANSLNYQGAQSQATYTGAVLLWQGETSIKASSILIDSANGDLTADGPVATVAVFKQTDKDGKTETSRSTATAQAMKYVEAERRATYTGEARMIGFQGDLSAPRIDVLLKPSGDEMDRLEAREGIALKVDDRKTKGVTLTYFGEDGHYVVNGTPVSIVDACGRETTGRTLTFSRSTDRIVIDGNEQNRTQTKGKSNCPGT